MACHPFILNSRVQGLEELVPSQCLETSGVIFSDYLYRAAGDGRMRFCIR